MLSQSFLSLLQLSSSSLPLGAFSYSEGLENLTVKQINNQEQLYFWLAQELIYGTIRLESAVMLRGYDNFNNLEQLKYWNSWLSGNKETEELRRQSWQMGKSLLQLLIKLNENSIFTEIQANLIDSCNYPLAFGIASAYGQIEQKFALLAYLQNWVSNLINAGIKLIPLGQTEGQQILTKINSIILQESQIILELKDDDLYACTLGLSLASMKHENQYTRLFRS